MSPTAAITLYISIFTVIFVIILLFLIFRLNKALAALYDQLNSLKTEVSQIREANREVVKTVVSPDAAHRLFYTPYKPKKKEVRAARRKELLHDADQKISEGLQKTETVVGLHILDKLGVISILLGLVFLVGLGIEYDWINTIGRVFFGLIIAGVLLISGYVFIGKFPVLGSALLGGGFGALIFTIFAAFYQYQLISVALAYLLVAMVVVIAVVVSIVTGRNEIAMLTFVAGFIAPFTVELIGKDYPVLFTYVILLNAGVIIFDYFRRSLFINLISYVFTFLIYAIWLVKQFLKPGAEIPFVGSITFLTIFYIMIFFVVLTNNIREGRKFLPLEFSLLVSATAMYYTAGYIIIKRVGVDYAGIFTLWIAIVNYAFFLWLYPRKNFDRRILNLFVALSMMFLALVIPVEFMGKSPTLVWALQAIVLMFVGVKAGLNGMKLGSLELTVLMLGSLAFDIYDQYVSTVGEIEAVTPLFNKAFFFTLLAVFSLFANAYILKWEKSEYFGFKFIKKNHYQAFLIVSGLVAFYMSVRLELMYAAIQIYDSEAVIKTYLSLLNYGLLMLLALPALFVKKRGMAYAALSAFFIAFAIYVFDYVYAWADLRNEFLLTPHVGIREYRLHYVSAFMLAVISFSALKSVTLIFKNNNALSYLTAFAVVALILVFLSNELDNVVIVKKYEPHLLIQALLQRIYRLHYTIAWGIFALLMILLGVFYNSSQLRVSGVLLYVFTLLKIGVYDFMKLGNEDLILIFVVMGLVMLSGSLVFHWYYRNKTAAQNIKEAAGL